jgi:sugar phosphate isomerase/epimerase
MRTLCRANNAVKNPSATGAEVMPLVGCGVPWYFCSVTSLRLEQIAFFDAGPVGLVDLAAEFGVPMVSFWTVPGETLPGATLVTEETKRSVRERLDSTGMRADSLEVFFMSASADLDGWRHALEIGSYLGATSAIAANRFLTDVSEAGDVFGRFASVVEEFGLTPCLEPISRGATRTLVQGAEVIRASGSTTGRLVADVLHLVRTGCVPGDIQQVDPALIGGAQICDGPAFLPDEALADESRYNRMVPGEGEFPLVDFVAALPPDITIGIEVPMNRRRDEGMGPRERAELMLAGTRRVLEQAAAQAT